MPEMMLPHQMKLLRSTKTKTLWLAGRASGKSRGGSRLVGKKIAERKSGIVSAQTFRALRTVMFREIEDFLKAYNIPYDYNKSLMIITIHYQEQDVFIHGTSAESFDETRGLTSMQYLVMDEAALHAAEAYRVLLGCLRGAGSPQVYMLTTPRGASNWTSRFIHDPDCEVITSGTHSNVFLEPDFLRLIESEYDGDFYRQEVLGEIVDTITQALLSPTDIRRCRAMEKPSRGLWRGVLGVDLGASLGRDPSCAVHREGSQFVSMQQWHIADQMHLADVIARYFMDSGASMMCVDNTGIGKGCTDRLIQLLPNKVVPINFGSKSIDERFCLERDRIWMTMAERCKAGVYIPRGDDWDALCEQMTTLEYKLLGNRLKLEPKALYASRLGGSPNEGDAAALSCAIPDQPIIESSLYVTQSYLPPSGSYSWMG